MDTHMINCLTCWNITSLILGGFLSAISTIILIRLFKPRICLEPPFFQVDKDKKLLKLPVKNKSKHYAAVNLRIEAAVVLNDYTYHLDLDRQEFIILSKNDGNKVETPYKRVYQAYDVASITKKIFPELKTIEDLVDILNKKGAYLRIRIHASHEFTGFGKAFEATFNFNRELFTPKCKKNICILKVTDNNQPGHNTG